MQLEVIVACDLNGAIGRNGAIPWHIREDIMRFQSITVGPNATEKKNVVIMGRKTWYSIPPLQRPLSHRNNIVVTSDPNNVAVISNKGAWSGSVHTAASFDDALKLAQSLSPSSTVYVIGGQRLYEEAILDPRTQRVHLTLVNMHAADCDAFFPLTVAYQQFPNVDILSTTSIYSFITMSRNSDATTRK